MEILIGYLNSINSEYQISTSDDEFYESSDYKKFNNLEPISNNIYCFNEKYYEKNTKIFELNGIMYTIDIFNDITKYAKEIMNSKIDCLTKLPNRAQIEKYLAKIDSECIVVMSDIDNFKKVNDIYGHQVGDSVISLTGDFIRNSIGKENFAGRYGGEEFLFVFNNTDQDYVKNKMNDFNKLLNKYTKPINVSVSTGIYKYDPKIEKIENAVRKADEALYYVKHNGKNNSMIYDDIKK
ncbi:MAG: GGDEF domain-containing protein [Bacilli bacterium]|nr:GGDEF domain-containing protein [Bacilli bacterium]